MTLIVGGQVERECRRAVRSGRPVWDRVAGGETFAGLFPDFVGQEWVIGANGLTVTDERQMVAVQILKAWGYL